MAKETNKLHNRLRMNFLKKILILLSSLCLAAIPAKAQEDCPEYTTMGTDFWAAFVPNAVRIDNGTFNTGAVASFIVTGEQSATVTVSNPGTNWSQTYTHTGGTKTYIGLPSHWDTTSAAPATMGYHVTSTQPVFVVASNFFKDSWDMCNLLPSSACGSNYIVQDLSLPDNPFAPAVVMVAKEDNTVITFTLPCAVRGLSQGAGSTVSVTLNAGQSYLLRSRNATTFCGMPVSANKPFALFQGHSCALVGASGGRDLCMAQARPLEMWGTEFVATSTMNRTEGDVVLVTSSANNCTVTINGAVAATLQSGQTHSFTLPANTAARIVTSQPAYVCLYPWSYNNGRTRGDPAAFPINPVNRWICHSQYPVHNCNSNTYDEQYIANNNHYLNIVTHAADTASISLDGQMLTGWSTSILPYCWKRVVTPPGTHTLHSTQGPFFAHTYGLGKWVGYGFDVGVRTDSIPPDTVPLPSCDNHASEGNDFWAGFIVNGGTEQPSILKLTVLGDSTCTYSVASPSQTLANNQSHTAGVPSACSVPTTYIPSNYSTTESKGLHLTSTANVQVIASFIQLASSSVTSLLPTEALGTRYIVLDYPADPGRASYTGATVTMVATQDNTTVTYTPPCPLYNSPSSAVGTPVTHTFAQAGQSLTLMANQGNASLSGMEINSNKPIALFQGNQLCGVPHNTPSGDMLYDQSIPVHLWGKHHAVVATVGRSVGDVVRVVADSACTLTLSNGTSYTLADHGVQEFNLPANQALMIDSDKPVSVALCSKGSDWNAEPGDGSMLMVPPMERGICHGNFMCFTSDRINKWYVAVVTDSPSTMTLDGAGIASQFSPIGTTGYSYARIHVMTQGAHGLDNSNGNFVAWTYGVGNVESYIYSIGQTWYPPEPPADIPVIRDTTHLYDSVCQGQQYTGHGFSFNASDVRPGIYNLWDSTQVSGVAADSVHYRVLHLEVLAPSTGTENRTLIAGDTLVFADSVITLAGTYHFVFTAANGCDSVVTLNVMYENTRLSVDADGVCPGEAVTITAEGTLTHLWSSNPNDPELDSQQGQNPITVHPEQTTTYNLVDAAGNTIASVTVGVEPPPDICFESNREYLDFDHPVLMLHNCSSERYHTTWEFDDGVTMTGERARRLIYHPLPDTVTVVMTVCNRYDCCNDTTLKFPMKILSVWLPNIFFPDGETNNRFMCYTSHEVVEFELEVFNRWGFTVWHTDDINTSWDGTHNGEPVQQGAYVYRWFIKDIYGEHRTGIGTVTLVR